MAMIRSVSSSKTALGFSKCIDHLESLLEQLISLLHGYYISLWTLLPARIMPTAYLGLAHPPAEDYLFSIHKGWEIHSPSPLVGQ